MFFLFLGLSSAATASFLLLREFIYRRKNSHFFTLPGPVCYPFIGNWPHVLARGTDYWDWYVENFRRLPDQAVCFKQWLPGQARAIYLREPQDVVHMLKTNFDNYHKGSEIRASLSSFLGLGIFVVDGAVWKRQRKKASRLFSVNMLRCQSVHISKHALRVVNSMEPGSVVDFESVCRRFAMSSSCHLILGIEAPDEEFLHHFDVCLEASTARFLSFGWKFYKTDLEKRLEVSTKALNKYIFRTIEERRSLLLKTDQQRTDLLSRCLQQEDEWDVNELCSLLKNFLFAAKDTTGAGLTFACYFLARHGDVQDKLRAHLISQGFSSGVELTYDNVHRHKDAASYLNAVIQETLRLFPPVPADQKEALGRDILPSGLVVERGDTLVYSAYAHARMPRFFQEPERFLPERWLDAKHLEYTKRSGYLDFVFNFGPRLCLGKDMAQVSMKIFLITLILQQKLSPGRSADPKPLYVTSITNRARGKMPLKILNID